MKILYLVHAFYPENQTGTEKFIYNMASAGQKNGHDVKVITYGFNQRFQDEQSFKHVIAWEYEYHNIPVIAFKYKKAQDLNNYVLANPKMRDFVTYILDREKPDLVHAGHLMRTGEFVQACIKRSIPYIVTLTDYFLVCPKCIMLKKNYQVCHSCDYGKACQQSCLEIDLDTVKRYRKAKYILQHASAITAPSQFVKDLFEREIKGINVRVVNHGLDCINQREKKKVYQKGDQINFGYMGSFGVHKGISSLIEVFSRLSANLYLYGFSSDNMLLNLIFKKYDIDNIKLGGRYTSAQLQGIIDTIDVLIVPSICNETYCFVIYEAMLNQVPVIVADGGALTEKIKNGVEGFTYEKNNTKQLEQIISLIMEYPEMLNMFKANISQFKIPTLAEETKTYQELYQSCYDCSNYLTIQHDDTEEAGLPFSLTFMEEAVYNVKKAEDIVISNEEWDDFTTAHSGRVERWLLLPLWYELDYLKGKCGNTSKTCVIWGAGNSGEITRIFLERFLPNFKIVGIIDSFQEGYFQGIRIYKPEELKRLKFEYVFIATTSGKEAAQNLFKKLGLKPIEDYFFGYGVN